MDRIGLTILVIIVVALLYFLLSPIVLGTLPVNLQNGSVNQPQQTQSIPFNQPIASQSIAGQPIASQPMISQPTQPLVTNPPQSSSSSGTLTQQPSSQPSTQTSSQTSSQSSSQPSTQQSLSSAYLIPTPIQVRNQQLKNNLYCIATANKGITSGSDIIVSMCDESIPTQRWTYNLNDLTIYLSNNPEMCVFMNNDDQNISLAPCRVNDKREQWTYSNGKFHNFGNPQLCIEPNQNVPGGSVEGGPCVDESFQKWIPVIETASSQT